VRRFTISPDRIDGDRVVFDHDESRHLGVLRLRPGDTVLAVDGEGREYTVRLESVGETARGAVLDVAARPTESPLRITLLQSVPKGDKMETIVRASTELGVTRVVPVLTARTVVALDSARWRDRARRWQRVAREAAKQCGRAVVPPIETPRVLDEALALEEPTDLRLCLWEAAGVGGDVALAPALPPALSRGAHVQLLVGPEGGLSSEEVDRARARGFTVVSAGPRILRTETAGPAIIAVLQARFGDLASPP
jgi:16S rRNA (uracil1498-N3)-methyltransferase